VQLSLRCQQEQAVITLPYPPQDIRLLDLLPMARRISSAIIKITLQQYQAAGHVIACDRCCQPQCCRHLIGLSTIEAAYLAEMLLRDSSRAALDCVQKCRQRTGHLGQLIAGNRQTYPTVWASSPTSALLFERWHDQLALDCLFLHANKCFIYPERPLVCRHWFAAGLPDACYAPNAVGRHNVSMPVNLTDVLIETACRCSGNYEVVLLPAIVSWYEQHAQRFMQRYPAGQLVWIFLKCLQEAVQKKANPEMAVHFRQIR